MPSPNSGRAGPWARLPMTSALVLAIAATLYTPQASAQSEAAVAAPPLTLEAALRQSAANDPGAAAVEARAAVSAAGVRQADVRPNPSLGLTVENFAGTGDIGLLDRSETTLTYEQRFERGGDREARVHLARAEGRLLTVMGAVRQLDRLEQVQRAWADALGAEADLAIARERLALAERFQAEVKRRVDMARDPLFAGARADAELAQAHIDFDTAEMTTRLARINLAKFWNGPATFSLSLAVFEDTSAAMRPAAPAASVDLEVFTAHRDIAMARVRLEQARSVPDATLSVGVRHLWEEGGVAVVAGGSLPLQRYDQNQAAVDRARAEGRVADADLALALQEREREIARLQVQLAMQAHEAGRIAEETLPEAERAVRLVREGFNRGGFTYNDVISAQRALLDLKARRVAVLKAFHLNLARLDRLTGAHASLLGLPETAR